METYASVNLQLGVVDHLVEQTFGYTGHLFKKFLGFPGQFSPNSLGLGLRLNRRLVKLNVFFQVPQRDVAGI